ncbi:hypothetical protein [Candidatus Protochlamydia phocaeensis]|uniref:hypothetical protein n=1 Tax=Candidatus Protochlamydia phocaeensis TaxID=1414722 RepID=UPI0008397F1D|nr:hypothetical protein [Candidatus Protochlamydia phocaeensis]
MDKHQSFKNPTQVLQEAIEKLDVFTQPEASRLEVGQDGMLVAKKTTALDRVIGLARCYISPLFSEQARLEQEKKLSQIKQEILQARDILKSHSSLIERLKEGDSAQQKLAQSALEAIYRYNALVVSDYSLWASKYDFYNYERNQLLLDEEIKGQTIELPHTFSVKYDSHPNDYAAQKTFKELRTTFLQGADKKKYASISSTHKKTAQFMTDTFRMKAIRMVQSHLFQQSTLAEVLSLIKQAPIEMEESHNLIAMRQLLEIGPGAVITLIGAFKRPSPDSKFMSMPILDSFRLASETTHAGFPYPSQHTGWALTETLTEANPLRTEQAALFQQVDQRRKRLASLLLFDTSYINRSRQLFRLRREAFDQNRELFINLHRRLHETILSNHAPSCNLNALDDFYNHVSNSSSPFDVFNDTQQRLLDLFIKKPAKQLEEEWLEGEASPLRIGTHQEKFQTALHRLQESQSKALALLDSDHPMTSYLRVMGPLLGDSSQSIILQYLSEKIGFAPPMLNDFERKIQVCAFQQLLFFLGQFEDSKEIWTREEIKGDLLKKYEMDIKIFACSSVEELNIFSSDLTNELEVYFNSRFYTQPRKNPFKPLLEIDN